METITLDNNYNIKIAHNISEIPENTFDINKLKILNLLKTNQITFKIDFSNILPKQYKKILKKF